jgi:hypothetical protein
MGRKVEEGDDRINIETELFFCKSGLPMNSSVNPKGMLTLRVRCREGREEN